MARLSVHKLKEWKAEGRRFAMITAYDYPSARLVEQAGIPIILVGDSLGSVVLGYDSTVPVTMARSSWPRVASPARPCTTRC